MSARVDSMRQSSRCLCDGVGARKPFDSRCTAGETYALSKQKLPIIGILQERTIDPPVCWKNCHSCLDNLPTVCISPPLHTQHQRLAGGAARAPVAVLALLVAPLIMLLSLLLPACAVCTAPAAC